MADDRSDVDHVLAELRGGAMSRTKLFAALKDGKAGIARPAATAALDYAMGLGWVRDDDGSLVLVNDPANPPIPT